MAITSNCAEIIITNPQGSVSFNKLITTTELSPAKTNYSEDRVYLIQNSENVPQTFWWNLEKAIADGYADLEELYDYFVAEIANQCGGGGGSSALFPNGTKIISSSRDFQSDDAGYILFLESNVSMTMPIVNPFSIHDNVGIMGSDESSSFNIENGGSPIRFAPNEVEGEVVLLTAELLDGNIYLLPISTSIVDDNGIRKTSIKYLYDKVNASGSGSVMIPVNPSDPTNPTTGSMYFNPSTNLLYIYNGTAWKSASFA